MLGITQPVKVHYLITDGRSVNSCNFFVKQLDNVYKDLNRQTLGLGKHAPGIYLIDTGNQNRKPVTKTGNKVNVH